MTGFATVSDYVKSSAAEFLLQSEQVGRNAPRLEHREADGTDKRIVLARWKVGKREVALHRIGLPDHGFACRRQLLRCRALHQGNAHARFDELKARMVIVSANDGLRLTSMLLQQSLGDDLKRAVEVRVDPRQRGDGWPTPTLRLRRPRCWNGNRERYLCEATALDVIVQNRFEHEPGIQVTRSEVRQ